LFAAHAISTWWPHIPAFIHSGVGNASSEGTNRVIKTIALNAYGFCNHVNQRLHVRADTTTRTQGRCDPHNFEEPF